MEKSSLKIFLVKLQTCATQQWYKKAVLSSELCEILQNISTIENQEMVVSDPTRLFSPRYYYD